MRTTSPRVRRLAAAGVLAAGLGLTADRVRAEPPAAAQPAAEPTQVPTTTPDYATRPVAYIYGNVPVTRADLAEFLIARGGYEKVELLVNKLIIEEEARKRQITVTPQEMEAALAEDLKGINVNKKEFVGLVLPKYGKSLYEWMEDVVRPRLLLTKMCRERVRVTDDDLKLAFERQYGEKRDVRVIIWPSGDDKRAIMKLWDDIRKNPEEFDRVARNQANPALASVGGHIKPIARHTPAPERVFEDTAFTLREGEVSQIIGTSQGYMVMKLLKVIPPDGNTTLEKIREKLSAEVFEQKLTAEIPKQFAELQKAAAPNVLLKGPPAQWQTAAPPTQTAEDLIRQQQQADPQSRPPQGGVTPAGGTAPPPMK